MESYLIKVTSCENTFNKFFNDSGYVYVAQNMQRSKIRKTSALASRGSKLSQLERLASKDVNQGIEMGK